jgi:hypothetical protein
MYDLSVEGESVEEVEELLNVLEATGLIKENFKQIVSTDAPEEGNTQLMCDASMVKPAATGVPDILSFVGPGEDNQTIIATPAKLSNSVSSVVKRDGDIFVLSPKFPGERAADAAMVLLAAYDQNKECPITGSKLLKSLKNTGYRLERVDKTLEPLEQGCFVLTDGVRRGRRYRLSESGRTKSQQLADELRALTGEPVQ